MVQNVKEQFQANGANIVSVSYNDKGEATFTKGSSRPDYQACIQISTEESLREMVPPALLVMCSPVLVGLLFGVESVSGLLVGALISAVQLAISQSNSGGAWDNAKKYVEGGNVKIEKNGEMVVQGKKTELHQASVV